MRDAKETILAAFRHKSELSTSDIVASVFPDELTRIVVLLKDPVTSDQQKKMLLDEKAKYHRRIAHHLQSLVKDDVLFCTRVMAKGEKCFAPKVNEGEDLIMQNKGRKIVVSRPSLPATPMEIYEHKNVLHKVLPDDWISRFNAILIEGRLIKDARHLHDSVSELFTAVNDVISINHFEDVIEREPDVLRALKDIEADAKMYDRRICLTIDMTNVIKEDVLIHFVSSILQEAHDHILLIFDTTSRELMMRSSFFEKIIVLYARAKLKLNIKNDDVLDAPLTIGKAGPYGFDDNQWRIFKKKKQKDTFAVGCGVASVVIDMKSFQDEFKQAHMLQECILQVAKSLFIANTQLRAHIDDYANLKVLNRESNVDLFSLSHNYIRLWNYDPLDPEARALQLTTLLEVRDALEQYAKAQETIYLSCGMPIRYNCNFSVAYRRFDKNFLLQQAFDHVKIARTEDLYDDKTKDLLLFLERMNNVMSFTNEARIARTGIINPADILREVSIILSSYRLSFFCYDFSNIDDTTTLEAFIR